MSEKSKSSAKAPPSDAFMKLMAPDGYYTYLGIDKLKLDGSSHHGDSSPPSLDEDLVRKNYRRLSLKHHPDRPGGDSETFHALNRAHKVLLHPKLREQYDLLGLDLDDVEDEHAQEDVDKNDNTKQDGEHSEGPTTAESIISHIFSAALLAIMQLGVRTVMMGTVSVFICRYRWTVFPALCFLAFIAFRMYTMASSTPGSSKLDLLSPMSIAAGLFLMYQGRSPPDVTWTYKFWAGEAVVMTMFGFNSFSTKAPMVALVGIFVAALLATLWLRGSVWRYATILGLEGFLAIVVALAFPLMEMVLEEIIKDKLRKVGEQVRAHAKRTEEYYAAKR